MYISLTALWTAQHEIERFVTALLQFARNHFSIRSSTALEPAIIVTSTHAHLDL